MDKKNMDSFEALKKGFDEVKLSINGQQNSDFYKNRVVALEKALSSSFPNLKSEEWKYTNIANLHDKQFYFGRKCEPVKRGIPFKLSDLVAEYESLLVFTNGQLDNESSVFPTDSGIEFTMMHDAHKLSEDWFLQNFDKISEPEADIFTNINTALAVEGVVLNVLPEKQIEKPIVIIWNTESNSCEDGFGAQTRNFFHIGKNANAVLIEVFVGNKIAEGFHTGVTEVLIEDHAHFEHYKIQNDPSKVIRFEQVFAQQGLKSMYHTLVATFEGKLVRNTLFVTQTGEFAETEMSGLYMPSGTSHFENRTKMNHAVPNGTSNELYKGVLRDKGRAVFNGKIMVWQDAQKTNAYQTNRNVLLSDEARADIKPQLEIFADDVKCSHGATTGRLDEESLFYMRSRGIGEKEAKALLVKAFAAEVSHTIKNSHVVDYIDQLIDDKLS